jgi:hypothetical protein
MEPVEQRDAQPVCRGPGREQQPRLPGNREPKKAPGSRERCALFRSIYLARSRYAPSRGFTRTRSPSLMNSGT